MHLVVMDTLLILLSLWLGYHHLRGQDITSVQQYQVLPSLTNNIGAAVANMLFLMYLSIDATSIGLVLILEFEGKNRVTLYISRHLLDV
jgi:threonine/homoserine efflux transporter RhtA